MCKVYGLGSVILHFDSIGWVLVTWSNLAAKGSGICSLWAVISQLHLHHYEKKGSTVGGLCQGILDNYLI